MNENRSHYNTSSFQRLLIPVTPHCDLDLLMTAAKHISGQGEVILVGIVQIPAGQSLSTGAMEARRVRAAINHWTGETQAAGKDIAASSLPEHALLHTIAAPRVHVSHEPWEELLDAIEDEDPDLVLLEWSTHFQDLDVSPQDALIRPLRNTLVRGPLKPDLQRILVALRGSPYADYCLRMGLAISSNAEAELSSLHLPPADDSNGSDEPFRGLSTVLDNLPEVQRLEQSTGDPLEAVLAESSRHDLLVLGASAEPRATGLSLGPLTEAVLNQAACAVIAVKTTRSLEMAEKSAISVLVDRWFAENTFHANEYDELHQLVEQKKAQNLTISLALPALNEEETVGKVIQTVKSSLMDEFPLLDEIVLIDSNSTDHTRQIASSLGVPVYIHQELLPAYGARSGKGEALWKSLYVTRGDILVWVDTDIVNIHPRFVYGLLGPLLLDPDVQFIKGFYRRPLKVGERVQAGGGGRVTELTARPLLNLFYPELSGVVQPLSGEYGGRRSALEQLTFFSGYGVETGLLIDVFEKFGLSAIAQVDLRERIHHNQPLESLSKMSFAIIQTVIQKLEQRYGLGFLEEINKSMKMIRYEPGRLFLEVEEIAELSRPPMIEIPEYRQRENQ